MRYASDDIGRHVDPLTMRIRGLMEQAEDLGLFDSVEAVTYELEAALMEDPLDAGARKRAIRALELIIAHVDGP